MNKEKIHEHLLQAGATFGFFTRLPIWRLADIPKQYYEKVVPFWAMVGWLTGGLMALTLVVTKGMPVIVCVVLALLSRTMLTGALHEDGFADFCDGFGGGYNRERILIIMKDSHIGTYGVLGLILYYILQVNVLAGIMNYCFDGCILWLLLTTADSWNKFISSSIVHFLPYARTEEESKNKLVYKKIEVKELLTGFIFVVLPFIGICITTGDSSFVWNVLLASIASAIAVGILFRYMKKRINGYTGDCCGATFIITEVVFYVALLWLLSR